MNWNLTNRTELVVNQRTNQLVTLDLTFVTLMSFPG